MRRTTIQYRLISAAMGQVLGVPAFMMLHPNVGCCCAAGIPQVHGLVCRHAFRVEWMMGRWHLALRIPNWTEDGTSIGAAIANEPLTDSIIEMSEWCSAATTSVSAPDSFRFVHTILQNHEPVTTHTGNAFSMSADKRHFRVLYDQSCLGNVQEYLLLDYGFFDGPMDDDLGESPQYSYIVLGGLSRALGWVLVQNMSSMSTRAYRDLIRERLQSLGLAVFDFRQTPAMRLAINCQFCGILPGTRCHADQHYMVDEQGEWLNETQVSIKIETSSVEEPPNLTEPKPMVMEL